MNNFLKVKQGEPKNTEAKATMVLYTGNVDYTQA